MPRRVVSSYGRLNPKNWLSPPPTTTRPRPQIKLLGKLPMEAGATHRRWGAQILPEIRPSDGKLNTVSFDYISRLVGMSGQRRICQFANVLPIAGKLIREMTPRGEKGGDPAAARDSLSHAK